MPGIGDPQNRYDEINSNKTLILKSITFMN